MSKPQAIICDIDGTLAHMDGKRTPYEYDKVGEDSVDETIRYIVNVYDAAGFVVLLVSGREASCFDRTVEWLDCNDVAFDDIFLRKTGDYRKDSIIKKELYETHIKDEYEILFVLDDRDQVVEMWRGEGLKCLQVQEGDF